MNSCTLVYIDEGKHELQNQQYYWLCGLAIGSALPIARLARTDSRLCHPSLARRTFSKIYLTRYSQFYTQLTSPGDGSDAFSTQYVVIPPRETALEFTQWEL